MNLSIIIVNYRAWQHVDSALRELGDDVPPDWEIIVVDNESERSAFEKFADKYPHVAFIANASNSGFGYGCIIGVRVSSGRQLLFMNPDVIAGVADIRALVAAKARHPDVGIMAARQVDATGRAQKVCDEFPGVLNQSKTLKYLRRTLVRKAGFEQDIAGDGVRYCDWVTGSFVLIDRKTYDDVGGWSPDFWMYAEDADLCRRVQDAGLRVACAQQVTVMHAHGGSSRINAAVRSLTKTEVVISKHVYVSRNLSGPRRYMAHVMIAGVRLPGLLLGSLLDLLTARRSALLRVRTMMLRGLAEYYRGVISKGTWLSPRALANQRADP